MPAYGECEHGGRYILDDYTWSRNLKKKARAANARLSREKAEFKEGVIQAIHRQEEEMNHGHKKRS